MLKLILVKELKMGLLQIQDFLALLNQPADCPTKQFGPFHPEYLAIHYGLHHLLVLLILSIILNVLIAVSHLSEVPGNDGP